MPAADIGSWRRVSAVSGDTNFDRRGDIKSAVMLAWCLRFHKEIFPSTSNFPLRSLPSIFTSLACRRVLHARLVLVEVALLSLAVGRVGQHLYSIHDVVRQKFLLC